MFKGWRKKYALVMLAFFAGTGQAFMFHWTAGEYTMFVATVVALFGGADLVDKGKFKQFSVQGMTE